jgi:hypothetical protein
LQRQVKVPAQPVGGEEIEQPVVELPGCDGSEPEAGDGSPCQDGLHQLEETARRIAVGRDLDPGDHDLVEATLAQSLDFTDDVVQRSTALAPAGVGDDAERAAHIAAVLDLDQGS